MRLLHHLKALFGKGIEKGSFESALKHFLETNCQALRKSDDPSEHRTFLAHLEELLRAEDASIQQTTLHWAIEAFVKHRNIPASIQDDVFRLIRPFNAPWLSYPLLEWINRLDSPQKADILLWLAELDYTSPMERANVIDTLLNRYLYTPTCDMHLIPPLKHLDAVDGEVTDLALHYFPAKTVEQNQRIIYLLGQTGRYRVVKPLIGFCQEYPEYLRPVMKALVRFEYDEVDQFYINCLSKSHKDNPMVLMEAIKQVRKRRLRKAISSLDALFPLEEHPNPLINQSLNGEIALAMASFGAYTWAREKLLSEIMLNGINQKYLKTIDILNLAEAIPLLKAIILMPETPEITALQHHAYQICERLLIHQRH